MKQAVLIDDNLYVVEGIKKNIEWAALGVEITAVFSDGTGVANYMREHPVDLLVTDINMPGLNGLDMAREILKEFPYIKIILISAYDDFDYARQAVRLGVFDYVEKPIDYDYLNIVANNAVRQLDHEARNRELLRRSRPALISNFFHDLLNAPYDESKYYLADSAEYLDIPIGYTSYLCIVMQIVDAVGIRRKIGSEAFHLFLFELKDGISGELSEVPFLFFLEQHNQISLVLGADTAPCSLVGEANEKLLVLLEAIEDRGVTVIAGIGRVQSSIWNLKRSYNEAVQVIKYRFFLPQKSLFDIRDFAGKSHESVFFTAEKEDELIKLILSKSFSGLRTYFAQLGAGFAKNLPNQSSVMLFAYDVVSKLLRFAIDFDIHDDKLQHEIQTFCGKLVVLSSVNEICLQLYELCERICKKLEDSSENAHKRLNKSIMAYIRDHYSDSDLSLSSIAAEVNVSSVYLSALFKKMNGINITETITDIRMEAAENLLRNSQMTIKEISEKVGYANPFYFSACFKKKIGRTPTKYRAIYENYI